MRRVGWDPVGRWSNEPRKRRKAAGMPGGLSEDSFDLGSIALARTLRRTTGDAVVVLGAIGRQHRLYRHNVVEHGCGHGDRPAPSKRGTARCRAALDVGEHCCHGNYSAVRGLVGFVCRPVSDGTVHRIMQ